MDKLIFQAGGTVSECGVIVRIKPSASTCITDLMHRTGKSATEIATEMIKFAYEHCEVRK